MQVVVIGAGIVGAAIADQLAVRGAKVIILEQSIPAAKASSRSFGWINANFAETPAYFRFRLAAINYFRDLCSRISLAQAVRWNGCLWWEDHGDELTAQYRQMQSRGYPCQIVDADTFASLEPQIENPPEASIRAELEGAANPALVTHTLLARAAENGATIITGCEALNMTANSAGSVHIETSAGSFIADQAVIAAGANADDLLVKADIRLPMDNKTGVILQTTPLQRLVDHVIMSPDVHFHQGRDGRLMLGEIFSGGMSDSNQDITEFAHEILARVKRRLPQAKAAKLETINLGVRPVPQDGLPVVGPARNCPSIYLASMHSGVTLAPFIGHLVANELLDETSEKILDEFRHERFGQQIARQSSADNPASI